MKNRLKQLLTLGSVYVIGGILEKGISFLFLPLITYYLAPKDYGIVGLMMLTVNLITPLFLSPVNGGVYRFYYSPDYQDKRDQIVFNGLLFIFFKLLFLGRQCFYLRKR
jgi:O-antigen/teichoic acid export membrane protein